MIYIVSSVSGQTPKNMNLMSHNIDWTTIPMPALDPRGNMLQQFGDVSATRNITIEHDGYLRGLVVCNGNATADIRLGTRVLTGITYLASGIDRIEQPFFLPVKAGTTLQVFISGGSSVKSLEVLAATY